MSTGRKIFATAQIVNGKIVIDLGDTANYMTVKGSDGIIFIVERNSKEFVEVKDKRYENQNLREVNRMEIYRDGVEIDILPETAKCCADDAERNPLNINMCPIGEQYCSGDCDYYTENQNLQNVTNM